MIPHERLMEGLSHEDCFVRSRIFMHLAYVEDRDVQTMYAVMGGIDRYGWNESYESPAQLAELAQDAGTLDWIAAQLDRPGEEPPDIETRAQLLFAFSGASLDLSELHLPRLEKAAKDPRILALTKSRTPYSPLEQARARLELAAEDGPTCLARLEKTLRHASRPDTRTLDPRDRLMWICERLTALGLPREEEISRWLEFDERKGSASPIAPRRCLVAVRLAGTRQLERLLPKLIALLSVESDLLYRGLTDAFVRIGTLETLDQVVKIYPELHWLARLYLTSVLEKVRYPGMESALRFLLEGEERDNLRVALAQALSLYASHEAFQLGKAIVEEDPLEEERYLLAQDLYAFMTLMGIDDPVLPEWRSLFDEHRRPEKNIHDRPFAPVRATAKSVGRNDPCPCGSGKKFKKCCLGKA